MWVIIEHLIIHPSDLSYSLHTRDIMWRPFTSLDEVEDALPGYYKRWRDFFGKW